MHNTHSVQVDSLENQRLWIKRYIGLILLFAAMQSAVDYRVPHASLLMNLALSFTANSIIMLCVCVGIFVVASFAGLMVKLTGKPMPWQRVINSSWNFSVGLGLLMLFVSYYSNR
jgi:hypothetical protein